MIKLVSIALYAIGGLFIYITNLLSFTFIPPLTVVNKLQIMAVLAILALIIIFLAMAISSFEAWKSRLGTVILSSVAVNAFVVLTFVCMQFSPDLLKSFPDFPHDFISDYGVGGITTFITFAAGLLSFRASAKNSQS